MCGQRFYTLFVLVILLDFYSPVCGDLILISERNVAGSVNGSASFTCRTANHQPIRWQHTTMQSGVPVVISSDGIAVNRRLASRIRVAWDQSIGESTLIITTLQSGDAGSYECSEIGNVKKGFDLTVIDANPMCQLNTSSSHGYRTFRPNDYVEVSCLVKYAGNWVPTVSCAANKVIISNSTNVTSRFVSQHFRVSGSTLMSTADDSGSVIFVCTAGFRGSKPSVAVTRGNTERDVMAPTFETTWISALHVSDEQTTRAWVGSNGSNGQLTVIMTSSILSVVAVLAICVVVMIVVMTRFMQKKRHEQQETSTKTATEEDTTDGPSRQPEVIDLQPVAPHGVVYNGGTHYDEINDETTDPHQMEPAKVPYEGLVGIVRASAPVPLPMYDNLGAGQ